MHHNPNMQTIFPRLITAHLSYNICKPYECKKDPSLCSCEDEWIEQMCLPQNLHAYAHYVSEHIADCAPLKDLKRAGWSKRRFCAYTAKHLVKLYFDDGLIPLSHLESTISLLN